MAIEFPQASFLGIDLAPVQRTDYPMNVSFDFMDASKPLPFPDGHFDVVHSRALVAGIRNWKAFVTELVRITAKDGIIVFVEGDVPMRIDDMVDGGISIAPSFVKWNQYLAM